MSLFDFCSSFTDDLRGINKLTDEDEIQRRIVLAAQVLAKFYRELKAANLSNYDNRKLSNQFVRLEHYLANTKQKMIPRREFRFSSRKYIPVEETELETIEPKAELTEFDLFNLSDQILHIDRVIHSIEDCYSCQFLLPPLQQLFVFRCRNCKFLNLETDAACFFEFLENCEISGMAHQLRFSNCSNCTISVTVNGPIVEKCRGLVFRRPETEIQGWDAIVDFSWLRTDIQSGNFSISGEQ